MLDKLIIRISVLVVVLFILLAVFYQRPQSVEKQRAPYLPANDFVARYEDGRRIFQQNCIECHGENMQGTSSGPPLVHPYYRPDHHGDIAFYLAVYQGVIQHHWQFGNMPAQKQLTPEDAGHILMYIRAEQKKAGLF